MTYLSRLARRRRRDTWGGAFIVLAVVALVLLTVALYLGAIWAVVAGIIAIANGTAGFWSIFGLIAGSLYLVYGLIDSVRK